MVKLGHYLLMSCLVITMMFIRLMLVSMVLTIISWVVLKLVRKSVHIGLVFLFWVFTIFGSMGLLYVISVWFVSN